MKRVIRVIVRAFCLVLCMGGAWAGIVGDTNPGHFVGPTVDWCQNFGCSNDYTEYPTPQAWVASDGVHTGTVGLVDTQQGFYNLQDGTSWNGAFSSGMGLVYNGASFGNTPADIAVTFDQGETGVGAYIQANFFGPFTAAITLYDINYQPLGTFETTGTSSYAPGTALFLGAWADTAGEVYAAQFDVVDQFGNDDFAIGEVLTTPEPASMGLIGAGLLGLVALARRRRS